MLFTPSASCRLHHCADTCPSILHTVFSRTVIGITSKIPKISTNKVRASGDSRLMSPQKWIPFHLFIALRCYENFGRASLKLLPTTYSESASDSVKLEQRVSVSAQIQDGDLALKPISSILLYLYTTMDTSHETTNIETIPTPRVSKSSPLSQFQKSPVKFNSPERT